MDSISGAISDSSCRLMDGAGYSEYSLVLPRRGRLELEAESEAFSPKAVVRDNSGHALATGSSIRASLEAGSYRVLVTGAGGDFKLRTNFIPEPNTWCRSFAAIGLNDAVSARLGDGSCRTPDGTRYDAYEFTSFGAGTLTVTLDATEIHPFLVLRDAEGKALATSDQGPLSYSISGDSNYTVAVLSPDAGQYTLKVAFASAEDATCRPSKTFTGSDQDTGQITSSACTYTDANGDTYAYAWYELNVTEPGRAELRATSSAFNPGLELIGPDGAVMAFDLTSSDTAQPLIQHPLRPGRYFVLLFGSTANGGNYTFQYTLQPEKVPCQPKALNSGAQITGTLSGGASCRTAEGLADVYQITTPGPGTLEIALISGNFDGFLALRDATDSRIVTDDDGAGGTNSYIAAALPAGTYSVAAATLDLPGTYGIAYQFTPHTLATCTSLPTLDTGYGANLATNSCLAANGQPADFYQFSTSSDSTVALAMISSRVDSFLELTDAQGNVLRRDDNGLGSGNALINQFLPAGSYRVTARATESPTYLPAYYEIYRFSSSGDRPAGCNPLKTLALGETVEGSLYFTACEYPDDNYADVYQLTLENPTQVKIALSSGDFDAYVMLVDGKGNVLAQDDDSGGNANASLSADLASGTYYVIARSYGGYTFGAYRLAVTNALPAQ